MTIQEIISNLDRTIEGKKILADLLEDSDKLANITMAKVLRINIHELKSIREDLLKVKA